MLAALKAIPFEDEELSPPEALDDLEPDEEHLQEATGNEGASFERTYSRAALTLWPTARKLAVLSRGGLAVTLPYLSDLTGHWNGSPTSTIWTGSNCPQGEAKSWGKS